MNYFKRTIGLLVMAALLLLNALLLESVCWMIKDIYYMNLSTLSLVLVWIALLFLLLGLIALIKEGYCLVVKYVKKNK